MNKPTRVEMKRKRRKKFRITVLVILLMGLSIYLLRTLKVFSIKEIKISGNSVLKSEDIIADLDEKTGMNIFKVKKSSIKRQISKSPYVKEIEVKRKLPSTILVNVKERVEKISFKEEEKRYITDIDGFLIRYVEKDTPYFTVIGYLPKDYEIGKTVFHKDSIHGEFINEIGKTGLIDKLKLVNFLEDGIIMTMVDGIIIEYGDIDDFEYRLNLLNTTIDKADEENILFNRIIMNRGENIILVTEEKGENNE